MNDEDERLLAACNQLANLAREVITDTETGDNGDMWSMVYGHLEMEAQSPEQQVEVFAREYNTLNRAAGTMILVLAQLYAEQAGISEVEAVDRAQAFVQAALDA